MARVTVEDCVLKVPNRFDLVMLAAQRAREISAGAELTVERDNDKNPVVALREIADDTVDKEYLFNALVTNQQKHFEIDEPEEDQPEFDALEGELMAQAARGDKAVAASEAAEEGEEDAEKAEEPSTTEGETDEES